MDTEEAAYHEVCAYTLSLGDAAFVHQHVVDAWAARRATPVTKPIAFFFALVGLYLHLEHGWTGRAVQKTSAGGSAGRGVTRLDPILGRAAQAAVRCRASE